MSSCKDSSDSVQESLSVDTDSRCGVSESCSGASLTAAVLTHVNHEDSEERGTTPESKCESIGEGEGECKGNEKSAAILLKSPQRSVRRRSKHSPSKKRENEDGIQELLDNIPEVAEEFDVFSKIGEGTFSSVYVASVKGVPDKRFAIKHLIPTSSSSRIENELRFLQMLGGRDNVMSISCCLRHRDHVALIMPYFQHDRFSDYVSQMTVSEARLYMRALFLALRNIHSHHIIHRDIKPSNFLYNRSTKEFQLVDFGLAHVESEKLSNKDKDQKGQPKVRPSSHKRASSRSSHASISTASPSVSVSKLTTTALSTTTAASSRLNGIVAPPQTYQRQVHRRVATRAAANASFAPGRQSMAANRTKVTTSGTGLGVGRGKGGGGERPGQSGGRGGGRSEAGGNGKESSETEEVVRLCPMRHKVTEVCTACLARSNQMAPRAGTPGFRAPEVLLKYPHQTTAVDVWSAGVILLCILSGRYPFFRAHDDMSALAQVVSLLGSRAASVAAKTYGKSLVCVPEVPAMDLKKLCSTLRSTSSKSTHSRRDRETQPAPNKKAKRSCNTETTLNGPNVRKSPRKLPQKEGNHYDGEDCETGSVSTADSDSWNQVPDSAYDLLIKCLDLNPTTRITAELALQHSFTVDNR